LPEAVIRFKQGFGRLIRHSDDRGTVVVLDARLLKKRYGQLFIASLPPSRRNFEPLEDLCLSIKSFIGRPILPVPQDTKIHAPDTKAPGTETTGEKKSKRHKRRNKI
jgi:hypothetical protein